MEEPTIKKEEVQHVKEKRNYTTPKLTVYGALTKLTGGGKKAHGEGTGGTLPSHES
jgi:hypothetical protein